MKILCVGWKLTKEERKTMEAIVQFIQGNIHNRDDIAAWVDCYEYESPDYDYTITFGRNAQVGCGIGNNVFLMPTPEGLKRDRQQSFYDLKNIIEKIKKTEEEKLVNTHVELQDGTTVGKEACDINITEKEAEYLKTLKGMLSGSKMVIIKGDLRVEVE